MDILRLEVRGSDNLLLSITVATSLLIWGWTFWGNQRNQKNQNESRDEIRMMTTRNVNRSPGSPRTRAAYHNKRGCTCRLIDTKDDCRQNKQHNKWNGSDEEEIDTDANLIPSSMRSTRQVMLNR